MSVKPNISAIHPLSQAARNRQIIQDKLLRDHLIELNMTRLILDSVGENVLDEIVTNLLELLGTSITIFEANGDYAAGVYSSGWCQYLNLASRQLCNTPDDRQALASGKWLCHECRWQQASRASINTRLPADVACSGGLHLYAFPILANGEVAGSICIGYGNPPNDPKKLAVIAERYGVSLEVLCDLSKSYQARSGFITNFAKRNLTGSAHLIGALIERKRAETEQERLVLKIDSERSHATSMAEIAVHRAAELEAFFNALVEPVAIYDVHGALQKINRSAAAIYGEDAIGLDSQSVAERLAVRHPDGREIPIEQLPIRRALRGEVVIGERYRIKNAQGKTMTALVSASPIHVMGELQGAVGIWHDLTQHEQMLAQMEQELQDRLKAEEQIRILARFPSENPNPVMRLDPGGLILYANEASQVLLDEWGCCVGQHLPQNLCDSVVGAFTSKEKKLIDIDLKTRVFALLLVPFPDAKYVNVYGRDVTARVRAVEDLQQARDELEARIQERTQELLQVNKRLLVEIAERKRAEGALRGANDYNRSLIEASIDPLVTISHEGKIGDVNSATELVTGFSRTDLIGKDFSDYFTEPDKARAGYRQVFTNGFVRDYPLEIRHKDGHVTPVLYNASIYRDEGGKVIGIFAAARDITIRKKAEEALRIANAYNRSLIEASLDPLVTISPEGKIGDVNSATELITGISRNDLIGTDFSDYFTEPKKARQGYQQVFIDGLVRDYPLEIRHKDGYLIPVLYNASLYRDEKGRVIGVFAAARDISERKRAERELLTANELLERVFASVDILIAYMDKEFNILRVNPTFAKAGGHPPEYYIGKNHFDLYPNEDNRNIFKKVAETGEPFTTYEKPLIFAEYPEKRIHYWDWSLLPVLDTEGEIRGLVLSLVDVTERKYATDLVRQNETRSQTQSSILQSLIDAGPDQQAVLEIVSQSTAALIGDACIIRLVSDDGTLLDPVAVHAPDMKIRQLITEWMTAHPMRVDEGLIRRVFQTGQSLLIPVVSGSNGNDQIILEDSPFTHLDKLASLMIAPMRVQGKILGTQALLRFSTGNPYSVEDQVLLQSLADRTALAVVNARLYKDLENALQQEQAMRKQLIFAEKQMALSRMVASVSHEINNPIQTIINSLFLAKQEVQAGSTMWEYLDMADTECHRISGLVSQLRELYRPSKAEAMQPIKILDVLDSVHLLLVPHLHHQNVEWRLNRTYGKNLIINGIPDQIKQVFINLSMNAIEAMQPNGGVLKVDLMESYPTHQVGIVFQDTGPGIPQEEISRIFEPFFTTKDSGTGLGLPICYDIIQRHNGQITVESDPGQGAKFTIWLPLMKSH